MQESSPGGRGARVRLAAEAEEYIPSQFFPNESPGSIIRGYGNENLESMTFSDGSIGLHISQDVFEHDFNPAEAFREIARTLQPGGAHVFTVPLVREGKRSQRRASLNSDGSVTYHHPAQYHGNPVDERVSLVTIDCGYDICEEIARSCGLHTEIHHIDDLSQGIRAKYIEVLVTRKPHHTDDNTETI